jgi:hypothetical protein
MKEGDASVRIEREKCIRWWNAIHTEQLGRSLQSSARASTGANQVLLFPIFFAVIFARGQAHDLCEHPSSPSLHLRPIKKARLFSQAP